MCIWVWVCALECKASQRTNGTGSSRAGATDSYTQVLEFKFRSTTRTVYAPNHLAISLSHAFVFSKQNFFFFF